MVVDEVQQKVEVASDHQETAKEGPEQPPADVYMRLDALQNAPYGIAYISLGLVKGFWTSTCACVCDNINKSFTSNASVTCKLHSVH